MVIGAVLVPGARAPRLVTETMIKSMEPGSVIVDVAVDQGGCIETCHPTTHDDPTYTVHGVIHYCVANMPGAVARTSPSRSTTPPWPTASRSPTRASSGGGGDKALARGLNTYMGQVTHKAVATAVNPNSSPSVH